MISHRFPASHCLNCIISRGKDLFGAVFHSHSLAAWEGDASTGTSSRVLTRQLAAGWHQLPQPKVLQVLHPNIVKVFVVQLLNVVWERREN